MLKGDGVLQCDDTSWFGIKNGRKVNGWMQQGDIEGGVGSLYENEWEDGIVIRDYDDSLVTVMITAAVGVSSAVYGVGIGADAGAGSVAVIAH